MVQGKCFRELQQHIPIQRFVGINSWALTWDLTWALTWDLVWSHLGPHLGHFTERYNASHLNATHKNDIFSFSAPSLLDGILDHVHTEENLHWVILLYIG